jgi:hypothetical protein
VRQLLANIPIRITASLHDTSVQMIESNYSKHIGEHSDDLSRRAAAGRAGRRQRHRHPRLMSAIRALRQSLVFRNGTLKSKARGQNYVASGAAGDPPSMQAQGRENSAESLRK